VVLIARTVTNTGNIAAPQGTAALAAGSEVLLREADGNERVFVRAPGGDVTNSGAISAAQAELKAAGGNIYALAGNNGGAIRATGTATVNGRVWLTADNGSIANEGTISAVNADGKGGSIGLSAASGFVSNTGALRADGAVGGRISIMADRILPQGKLAADGNARGQIAIGFGSAYIDTQGAASSARGTGAADEALQFCRALHEDLKQTRAFCAALDAAGLLVANQATIALRSGASLRLEGFKVIDLAKFDAVDDAQFLEWRRRGWLTLIYAHFLSTARWAGIVDLTAAAEPAQAR
jgi:hypothetical protein